MLNFFIFNSVDLITLEILGFLLYHAILLILPMAFFAVLSFRKGVHNLFLAVSIGACASGILAYVAFWFRFLFPNVHHWGPVPYIVIALVWIFGLKKPSVLGIWPQGGRVIVLWLCYAMFILAAGYAPTGARSVLGDPAVRFSHPLPVDNQLPYVFAEQIAEGQVSKPMIGDWLSSDRPPLQTGYFLASCTARLHWDQDLSYQVLSTLLQCLWVIPMWLILWSRKVGRAAILLTLSVTMFSGFAIVHSFFVWPKLIPVFFILLCFGILFDDNITQEFPWTSGITAGCLAALSMLCHGGSVLALLGIGLTLVTYKKIPKARFILGVFGAGLILMITWSYYQSHFDPPGNRLLKWYLAGVVPIDNRSFGQALKDSYAALTFQKFIELKMANLRCLWGDFFAWGPSLLHTAFGSSSVAERYALRMTQFFCFFASLGLFVLSPLALLFRGTLRSEAERSLGEKFLVTSIWICFVWVLLFFGPATTVLHQGSLALLVFALGGCVLFVAGRSIVAAVVLSLIHFSTVFFIYFKDGWVVEGVSPSNSLYIAAIVSFLATLASLNSLYKEDHL